MEKTPREIVTICDLYILPKEVTISRKKQAFTAKMGDTEKLFYGYPIKGLGIDFVYSKDTRSITHVRSGKSLIRGFVNTSISRSIFGMLWLLRSQLATQENVAIFQKVLTEEGHTLEEVQNLINILLNWDISHCTANDTQATV